MHTFRNPCFRTSSNFLNLRARSVNSGAFRKELFYEHSGATGAALNLRPRGASAAPVLRYPFALPVVTLQSFSLIKN